mmetsp:Transcript_15583/g.26821  ORF Transcript_15583/g.26821 Transcript_15583/m.26821 type:complete len:243 (-) Transcript_15583:125-853(-)
MAQHRWRAASRPGGHRQVRRGHTQGAVREHHPHGRVVPVPQLQGASRQGDGRPCARGKVQGEGACCAIGSGAQVQRFHWRVDCGVAGLVPADVDISARVPGDGAHVVGQAMPLTTAVCFLCPPPANQQITAPFLHHPHSESVPPATNISPPVRTPAARVIVYQWRGLRLCLPPPVICVAHAAAALARHAFIPSVGKNMPNTTFRLALRSDPPTLSLFCHLQVIEYSHSLYVRFHGCRHTHTH